MAESVAEVQNMWPDSVAETRIISATDEDLKRKAREFRRKLVRNSAIPGWYKQRTAAPACDLRRGAGGALPSPQSPLPRFTK
jgi:hypothetical protein